MLTKQPGTHIDEYKHDSIIPKVYEAYEDHPTMADIVKINLSNAVERQNTREYIEINSELERMNVRQTIFNYAASLRD